MYDGPKTSVTVNGVQSEHFEVKVGVHQGSVLSPILFIMVLEAMSQEFRGSFPWELLHADDLVLIADSVEEVMGKYTGWKEGMEARGLKVNIGKTKVLNSGTGEGSVEKKKEGGGPVLSVEKVEVAIQYCVNPASAGCTRGVVASGVDCRWYLTSNVLFAQVNM